MRLSELLRPARIAPVAFLAIAAVVAACGDESTTPVGPIPLARTTWYMHQADSSALPVRIHQRNVGVLLEETWVDSSRLTLTALDTYEQSYWLRVNLNGALDRYEVVVDRGTFVQSGGGYAFTSQLRDREFLLATPGSGIVQTHEQMIYLATDPPITFGLYYLTHP